jgi:hypothetical protein
MAPCGFVTRWQLEASLDDVWNAIVQAEAWPRWWRYLRRVELVESGDADGVGAVRRFVWSSRLPYRLAFDMRTASLERLRFIEGTAAGELNGSGPWDFSVQGAVNTVRYTWIVATDRPWMNRLAPILAPVFRWNHDGVMAQRGRGLARYLGVRLVGLTAAATPALAAVGGRSDR